MPDRWRLIEDLYHRAVALPADERAAFLDNACRADSELRAEIDSLLAEGSGPASFMRLPAIEHTARDLAVAEPLVTGQQFGPFKILEPAGKGAMGEVYRARDLKLGRDVAIKVLPPSFVLDAGRVARFDLEARVLAALNHPNIATIHGVEEFDDRKLLVLEFVEGITLAERLTTGALPVREAVDLAIQIADALESAHEHGIVHRDLKPANIKVRPDGKVKVLDFGLAKQSVSFAAQGVTQSLEPQATHQGTIVGTAGYMAPEQATGQPVDRRADIWAFGVVLYEMVTGTAPFSGKTTSEILSRVIAQDPDLGALPQSVRALVEKCLRKDPRTRWQWIGDVRLLLEEGSSGAVLDVQHSLPAHALSRPHPRDHGDSLRRRPGGRRRALCWTGRTSHPDHALHRADSGRCPGRCQLRRVT